MTETTVKLRPAKQRVTSVTKTLRLDSDVDNRLTDLAEREGVSVNVLANRAIRKFVEWDVYAQRFGFMTTSHSMQEKLFSKLTDDEAREMGREMGKNAGPEFVIFFFKKFNFEMVLKAAELLGTAYGNAYTFEHSFDGKLHTIILKHDMGPRMSAYLAESWKMIGERLGVQLDLSETEDQVAIKIRR